MSHRNFGSHQSALFYRLPKFAINQYFHAS